MRWFCSQSRCEIVCQWIMPVLYETKDVHFTNVILKNTHRCGQKVITWSSRILKNILGHVSEHLNEWTQFMSACVTPLLVHTLNSHVKHHQIWQLYSPYGQVAWSNAIAPFATMWQLAFGHLHAQSPLATLMSQLTLLLYCYWEKVRAPISMSRSLLYLFNDCFALGGIP